LSFLIAEAPLEAPRALQRSNFSAHTLAQTYCGSDREKMACIQWCQCAAKAVVPCQNKIILKNFRLEPPPSVDRTKIILFQHGATSKIILKNFMLFQCFILT